jgi:5-methylcytosine-specific restriction endonuclease McrA
VKGFDVTELKRLAKQHGLTVVSRPNEHYQIMGKLLVNYYPDAKKPSVYIAGTKKGIPCNSPEKAIKLALTMPEKNDYKRPKRNNPRRKKRLFEKSNRCHWCDKIMMYEEATQDHVIPIARGGLNNANNIVLSCRPCNSKRGHAMPELQLVK